MELPPDHLRAVLQNGQLSQRKVKVNYPAVFGDPGEQLDPALVFEELQPLLFSDLTKVGHNVKFDLMTVAKYYGGEIPPGPYHDTIVLTHVLDEDRMSYDLKTLTADWFKVPHKERAAWYPNLGKQGTDNFGLDTVARYLAKDIRYAWMRFQDLIPRLEAASGLRAGDDFEMQVYRHRIDGVHGFGLTSPSWTRCGRIVGQIAAIEEEAWKLAGTSSPSPTSTPSVGCCSGNTRKDRNGGSIPVYGKHRKKLATQGLNVRGRARRPGGSGDLGSKLEFYADRGTAWPTCQAVGRAGEAAGHLHRRHRGFLSPQRCLATVHPGFQLHGTVTGRFSASEPNIHQLPREQKGAPPSATCSWLAQGDA
jgi:hypothetical protein